MSWNNAFGAKWVLIFGIISSVWGFPSVLDDANTWKIWWTGYVTSTISNIAFGFGLALIGTWITVKLQPRASVWLAEFCKEIRKETVEFIEMIKSPRYWAILVPLLLFMLVFGVGGYFTIGIYYASD